MKASMRVTLMVALVSAGVIMPPPVAAHSTQAVEETLQQEERYAQVVNQPAPAFDLEDLEGRRWRLSDFAGMAVILNFVYARCQDVCPLHMVGIAELQRMMNTARMQEVVQFITIATDTEDAAETAKAMAPYRQRFGLDPVNWMFLYGGADDPGAGIRLADRYGLKFVPSDDGDQMHAVVTHVIDREGRMRARFHGLRFEPVKLVAYANSLAFDVHDEETADADGESFAQTGSAVWSLMGAGALLAASLAYGWHRRRLSRKTGSAE